MIYPNTYHDVDNPALCKLSVRHEMPNGVKYGQGVTVAPKRQAREAVIKEVLPFLEEFRGKLKRLCQTYTKLMPKYP